MERSESRYPWSRKLPVMKDRSKTVQSLKVLSQESPFTSVSDFHLHNPPVIHLMVWVRVVHTILVSFSTARKASQWDGKESNEDEELSTWKIPGRWRSGSSMEKKATWITLGQHSRPATTRTLCGAALCGRTEHPGSKASLFLSFYPARLFSIKQ